MRRLWPCIGKAADGINPCPACPPKPLSSEASAQEDGEGGDRVFHHHHKKDNDHDRLF
jgi:hypothetical protein